MLLCFSWPGRCAFDVIYMRRSSATEILRYVTLPYVTTDFSSSQGSYILLRSPVTSPSLPFFCVTWLDAVQVQSEEHAENDVKSQASHLSYIKTP